MIEWLTDKTVWVSMAPALVIIALALGIGYSIYNPSWILAMMQSPTFGRDVAIAFGTTLFLGLVYHFVLRPEVRVNTFTKIDQQCPDRWVLNTKSGECEPRYRTSCKPFRPDRFKSYQEQCDFASACGTTWGGQCV